MGHVYGACSECAMSIFAFVIFIGIFWRVHVWSVCGVSILDGGVSQFDVYVCFCVARVW